MAGDKKGLVGPAVARVGREASTPQVLRFREALATLGMTERIDHPN